MHWVDPLGLSCKKANSWNQFQKRSRGVFSSSKQAATGYSLWKQQDWNSLEGMLPPESWPPNRGAVAVSNVNLGLGTEIDRYGGWVDADGFHDRGTFVSPAGTPFERRALPAETLNRPYKKYKVVKPIDAEASAAIPWFGEPGMGTQYELPMGIDDLVEAGFLQPV